LLSCSPIQYYDLKNKFDNKLDVGFSVLVEAIGRKKDFIENGK